MAEQDAQRQILGTVAIQRRLETIPCGAGDEGHHEADAGTQPDHGLGRLHEQIGHQGEFALPAARQQGHDLAFRRQAQRFPRRRPIRVQGQDIRQRVPHIGGGNPGRLVDGRFEGKQEQHVGDGTADRAQAAAPPGPHRGAHILESGNAGPLQPPLQPQIEIRRVDADEQIGRLAQKMLSQRPADAQDGGQAAHGLHVAAHGQGFHGEQGVHTGGDHFRAADALEAGPWQPRLKRPDEMAAQQIARRFSRHDADAHLVHGRFGEAQRMMPRVERSRKSSSKRTAGSPAACSARATRACSRVRPER